MEVPTGADEFVSWLVGEMNRMRPPWNQARLARELDTKSSTVHGWIFKGARPREERFIVGLANAFGCTPDEVRHRARPSIDYPKGGEADAEIPGWLRRLLPVLIQLNDAEAGWLADSAHGLLNMREDRSRVESR